MDDIPTYTKIVDAVIALLAALVLWFSRRSVKQFDDRIEVLERDSVRLAFLNQFRQQLANEHEDNRDRLERIEDRVDKIFDRMIK